MATNGNGILTEAEAAQMIAGLKPQTLSKWRLRHRGPKFLKLGGKVRYRVTDIQAWMDSCLIDPALLPPTARKHSKRKAA